jgi:RNA polymerase sigma-70 factor (ECF subfamily)
VGIGEAGCTRNLEGEVVALFDQFHESIYHYLLGVLGDVSDAEDATQEVFLRLYKEMRKGRKLRNVRSWLFHVAHNLAVDRERSRAAERLHLTGTEWTEEQAPRNDPEVEQQLQSNERWQLIESALAWLAPEERHCLELRREGFKYREIAQILGVKIPMVQRWLLKAVKRIAEATGD